MAVKEHYNIQINIQQVREVDGTGRGDDKRFVTELVMVNVTADTLEQATAKAHALMDAAADQ